MSKYRIFIHDTIGSSPAYSLLEDAKLESFTRRINTYGQCSFILPKYSPNATPTKLQKYRRVTLQRQKNDTTQDYVNVWYGYIENHSAISDSEIQVSCMEMLKFFKKRFAGDSEQFNGQGSTEAHDLLTATNTTDGDTGVDVGDGGVTGTKDIQVSGSDCLRAWELLADAHNAEFEIDPDGGFNFVSSLGTDKSSTLTLVFRRDNDESNMRTYEDGEDGEEMVNKLIGKSSGGGGLTSTQTDSTSQSTYGVLIGKHVFNEANDQTTLDQMTSTLLTQLANPLADSKLLPLVGARSFNPVTGNREVSTMDYGDFYIGDLVTVRIITENQNIDTTKRIAEVEVAINDNEEEEIRITPTSAGVFITAAYLDFDVTSELKRKIQEIELLL